MTESSPTFYGVLIGIDHYQSQGFQPLYGCVRDVRQMEMFLRTRLKYPKKHIHTLVAPHPGEDESEGAPTYEHIIGAIWWVIEHARAADLVWIYYAGHGSRVPTCCPQAKGLDGQDEVLVPVQRNAQKARYVRDIELSYLLTRMVEKGLIVTLVLDCCHSGGATRGNEHVLIRGIGPIDPGPQPTESLVASSRELSENWLALCAGGTRGFEISSAWLPQPQGYVLLAACRDFEGARESRLVGSGHHGVFTYHLLDALRQMAPESTYRMLYHRVRAKMHARFTGQTPQLEGEHDRVVFGSRHIDRVYAVNVLDVQPCEDHHGSVVELDAGQLHTLQVGAQFWIYPNPLRVSSPLEAKQRLAWIEISESGAVYSRALISSEEARRIEVGDQAVLVTPGLRLSHRVRVVIPSPPVPGELQERLSREVIAALGRHNGAFLRLADASEDPDFLVAITADLHYEIQDADGQPLRNQRPALSARQPGAAGLLVERLVHLAKYRNVLRLENQDGHLSLAGNLHIELRRQQEREQTRRRSEAGSSLILEPGEKVDLLITNHSWMRLHVAVLDLAQDWSIQQLYPPSDTFALEPQKTEVIPLEAFLATSYDEGTDILKVFAALEVTDFGGLSLPPLDRPGMSGRARGGSRNALEALLEAFHADAPSERALRVLTKAEWEWTSACIEVYMRRR